MLARVVCAALIYAASSVCAEAQTDPLSGYPLSLEEAERRGLELNPQIAEARLGIDAADFLIVQRQGAFEPVFSTSLSHRAQLNPAATQLTGGINTVENQTSSYTSSVTTPLQSTGGRLDFEFNNDRTSTSNLFSNFNPSYSSSLVASFVQPLFRGLRIDQPRQQLQQARISRDAAAATLRQQAGQISAAVRRAYWDLVYTVDALRNARQSRDLATRQLQENRLRLELGTIAQIDVLQSEVEVATRAQAAVVAEGTWRSAQVALKRLIVPDTRDPLWTTTVVPADRPTYDAAPSLDLDVAIARALANRTDIEAIRRQTESVELNLRLLGDEQKPAVDLAASLALAGIGGTRILRSGDGLGSTGVGSIPGGYGDALQTLSSLDFPTWNVGVTFSIPFRNTQVTAALARGRIERRQLDASLRTIELQVAAAMTQIADQVTNASQQVQAATIARRLAEQRLDLETSRLQAGLSTTFLVLQAQRDLATAQTTELRAVLDYRKALVDFEQAQEAP